MTFRTSQFEEHNKSGHIIKVNAKCRFHNGKREVQRALHFNGMTGELCVKYNGEWEVFKPYSPDTQAYSDEYLIGRI